jgi:glycine/D-amino acid oxidase-like deaminating enzyme
MSAAAKKHVVVVGGGIQGAAVAYNLVKLSQRTDQSTTTTTTTSSYRVTVLEAVRPAAAASGKGGGFMGRSWGDGSVTQSMHQVAFDLYEQLATQLPLSTYRKLPVLSVSPSSSSSPSALRDPNVAEFIPSWLDGAVGRMRVMGRGDDTAQVTPSEVVEQMLAAYPNDIVTVIGKCVGMETSLSSETNRRALTGVRYTTTASSEEMILAADAVVICAGPWSCLAEDWFSSTTMPNDDGPTLQLQLPMEGIKSTSIVWKPPSDAGPDTVDATALFCGEDSRFGTHCEYPH